jgi:UDP-N-acetyl-D-glucosamine dehydrogenase
MTTVAVVGLGYVGLPLAVRAAGVGHRVVGLERDPRKTEALVAGRSYVEDVADTDLRAVLLAHRFEPRLADGADTGLGRDGFDVGVITVPTPLRDGKPDLSFVEAAARTLGRSLRPGALVVLESTSYPGTTEGPVADVIEEESGLRPGAGYHLGFSPERIDPGNPVHTFVTTPKIVSGSDPAALAEVTRFYTGLVDTVVPVSTPRVAELAKLFENIFSQVNIALVNELAMLAHELGIDVWEAIEAADTKPHGFLRHVPGPGVGGHCIPIDPGYLTWFVHRELGRPFRLSQLAQSINDQMPEYVVTRAMSALGRETSLEGASVLLLGVAYKPGTGDVRGSPAVEIVRLLRERGAVVAVTDPHVRDWTMTPVLVSERLRARAADFDLAILVTDHEAFDYADLAVRCRRVLDCRHRMAPSATVETL